MLAAIAWLYMKVRSWLDKLESDAIQSYNADNRRERGHR